MLTKSKNIKLEYCCTVVKIGKIIPIEGSDFLGKTLVNGLTIVVRKDQVKEGDIMIYSSNETQLDNNFLSINNLYRDSKFNIDNTKSGYFELNRRVKMIKLKGCPSMGFLFSIDEFINYCNKLKKIDFNSLIGTDFDTVDGKLFVKAYIPEQKSFENISKDVKRNKKLISFNRIIPGEFMFHYDTSPLNRCIDRINPDDVITISLKIHGTSCIIGNVLTNKSRWNNKFYNKIFPYLPKFLQFTKQEYDVIYSSRTVIKNKDINPKVTEGYYKQDIWKDYYDLLKNYIPKGMTIYGEIIGFITNTNTYIQSGYDYGCVPGTNKLMIYRISTKIDQFRSYEWNISEIYDYTKKLIETYPNLNDKIFPIEILYHGTLKDLYPDININRHWHENVLERLKVEKKFKMEEQEPLCKNKVYREGIVLRIDNDPIKEAFKLKCLNFLNAESRLIDKGIVDIELTQSNY